MSSFYEILQVNAHANQEEIKKSYRRLAMSFHPDKNPHPDSKVHFQKIQEAYRTLGNFEKRKKYDAWLLYGGSILERNGSNNTTANGRDRDRRRSRGQTVRNQPGYKSYHQKKKEPDHDFATLETIMFYSLLLIGFTAIFFAIRDLVFGEWTGINSLTGIVFGISFTSLLAFTYYQFYRRKDK